MNLREPLMHGELRRNESLSFPGQFLEFYAANEASVHDGGSESDYESANYPNGSWELPIDMQFNDGHIIAIVLYSLLFVLSSVGNITLLVTIVRLRMKSRLNRVDLFLLHLAIADLLVTFLLMPLEIGWAATVSWKAGDLACRVMSFFRIFGLYLSGFLLVCISLDRYFAVLKPLTLPEANRRGRLMLYAAWGGSVLCSFPQALIFHVEKHPVATWFEQCVTFNSFPSEATELAYSIFGFVFLYGFPLVMIIGCYGCILCEICKINNLSHTEENMRRSNTGALNRAKIRTLKMTIVIVATFFLCWTPYNVMSLWYWIDKDSALNVDQRIQKGLFLFACTNSCVNPMVYGFFHIRRGTKEATSDGKKKTSEREPYKLRVRWKPRTECLCAASGSSRMNSSSSGVAGRPCQRALHEIYERKITVIGGLMQNPKSLSMSSRLNNNTRKRPDAYRGFKPRNGPKKGKRVKFVNINNIDYDLEHGKDFVFRISNLYCEKNQASIAPSMCTEQPINMQHNDNDSDSFYCTCRWEETSAQSLPIFKSCGSFGSSGGIYFDALLPVSSSRSECDVTLGKRNSSIGGVKNLRESCDSLAHSHR